MDEDLVYAAGFLDGEGCFCTKKPPYYAPAIVCSTTHRPTIEWLHSKFGGNFSVAYRKPKPNHRQCYRWAVVNREAVACASKIAPFLKEKAEQALLIVAIGQLHRMPLKGRNVDPEVAEERKRLALKLKELKRVAS